MEDPNSIHQWDLGSDLHQLIITPEDIWEDTQVYSFSSESYSSYPDSFITSANTMSGSSMEYSAHHIEKPEKQAKSSSWDSSCSKRLKSSSAPTILSFGRPDSPDDGSELYESIITCGVAKTKEGKMKISDSNAAKMSNATTAEQGAKKPLPHIQEHVIAERKRREKLSQNFIALSAIVPGLKKMDKASVLGDAIKYLKQLQEKVMKLEDQAAQRTVDSVVLVKKSQLLATDDDTSSICDENSKTGLASDENLIGIEARLSDKSILIRIHCKNQKGVLVKALSEIESLNLTVINTSVLPFACSSLDITVMAQIEEGFSMTVNDLVNELNSALRQVM